MSIMNSVKATGIYRSINHWLETTYVTHDHIPLKKILSILLKQLAKDNLPQKGSAMAFSFVLSIFPSIIFIFTVIPYTPLPDARGELMDFLSSNMPDTLYNAVYKTIEDIIIIPHGGLLSFGFVTALFSVTSGIRTMITAFNNCYRTKEDRSFIKLVMVATGLALFLSFIFVITIALSIFVRVYISLLENDLLHNQEVYSSMLLFFKYLVLFGLFYFALSIIYYFAPVIHEKWSFFSIGAFIAALCTVLFTVAFFFYISSFNSYNKVYGSIGAFIGIMMWFYIFSIVLLLGFEINASIHMAQQEIRGKTT